jgi:hypothetical protein
MAITFDPINKLILLPNVTSITVQEIYNAAMDWHDEQGSMDDEPPMRSTGFANLGGGAYSDKIFVLQKDWKLKPCSGTYTLTVVGTIIALDDAGNPYDRTVPPDSGIVTWVFQVTSQGIISVSGSGVTEQDKIDIANKVETQTGVPIKTKVNPLPSDPASESGVVTEVQTQLTDVQVQTTNIEQHHILRRKIEGDYLYYYDGQTVVAKYKLIKDGDGRIIERIPETP